VKRRISLFQRTSLTIAIGLLVFQIASGVAMFTNLVLPLAQRSADDLADLLILSARAWDELPTDKRQAFQSELQEKYALNLLESQVVSPQEFSIYPYIHFLRSALTSRLPGQIPRVSEEAHERFQVVFTQNGRPLYFEFSKDRITPSPRWALAWIVLSGILSTLCLAWLLARRVTKPIAKLAIAARRFANSGQITQLPETGDAEFADLARIFNETSRQLLAQRENQTTLLAGVSHDLRSPLARMKMAVGLLAEENTSPLLQRLEHDIAEMDALIGAQLELARAQETEQSQLTDIDALLVDLVDAAEAQAPGHLQLRAASPTCVVDIAPMSLRRCIGNLLGNALHYGGEFDIQVVRRRFKGKIFIGVCDRGPGIPPQMMETVFRPFYRLESSRNRMTGGSGLGLAITRQLAETHDWHVAIKSRAGGGTSVWLVIPQNPTLLSDQPETLVRKKHVIFR
jgi:two-component system osmolarity sensor histidine kinase EnvZ